MGGISREAPPLLSVSFFSLPADSSPPAGPPPSDLPLITVSPLLLPFTSGSPRAQCASLTPTPPNRCPSPTSVHTSPSASTRDLTFAPPALSMTPRRRRKRTMMKTVLVVASTLWPSPMTSPAGLSVQVTLHGRVTLPTRPQVEGA